MFVNNFEAGERFFWVRRSGGFIINISLTWFFDKREKRNGKKWRLTTSATFFWNLRDYYFSKREFSLSNTHTPHCAPWAARIFHLSFSRQPRARPNITLRVRFLKKKVKNIFQSVEKSASRPHLQDYLLFYRLVWGERKNVYKNPIVPSSTPSRGLSFLCYIFLAILRRKIKRNIQIWWELSTSWLLPAHCHNIDFSPADSWRVESTDKEKYRVSSIVISLQRKNIEIGKKSKWQTDRILD